MSLAISTCTSGSMRVTIAWFPVPSIIPINTPNEFSICWIAWPLRPTRCGTALRGMSPPVDRRRLAPLIRRGSFTTRRGGHHRVWEKTGRKFGKWVERGCNAFRCLYHTALLSLTASLILSLEIHTPPFLSSCGITRKMSRSVASALSGCYQFQVVYSSGSHRQRCPAWKSMLRLSSTSLDSRQEGPASPSLMAWDHASSSPVFLLIVHWIGFTGLHALNASPSSDGWPVAGERSRNLPRPVWVLCSIIGDKSLIDFCGFAFVDSRLPPPIVFSGRLSRSRCSFSTNLCAQLRRAT